LILRSFYEFCSKVSTSAEVNGVVANGSIKISNDQSAPLSLPKANELVPDLRANNGRYISRAAVVAFKIYAPGTMTAEWKKTFKLI
jgi:hypothetical protein